MRPILTRSFSVLFVTMVIAAACVGDESGPGGETPLAGATGGTDSLTLTPEAAPGPFFLDLRTGERLPLPEHLVGDGTCGYLASPDRTRVAYQTCGGNIYGSPADVATIANIDGTDARTLEVPEGLNASVRAWSPDGTKLAYQLRKGGTRDIGDLFVHDLSSGEQTQLTHLELTTAPWYWLNMSFTPDGRNVVFHLPRSSSIETRWDVWSVPVTGGEPTLVLRNAASPVYLSGGEELAFIAPATSAFDGQSIAIANGDGSRRTLVEANEGIGFQAMSPDGSRIAYADGGCHIAIGADCSVYVVEVATGESTKVAEGTWSAWLDDDTLIVTP